MKFADIHWHGRMEVFLSARDSSHEFPYEAHITSDGVQRRGWGTTPRLAIIDSITEHRDDNEGDYFVGINPVEGEQGSGVPLRRFHTEEAASEFVGKLIGAEHGLYYIDGPER